MAWSAEYRGDDVRVVAWQKTGKKRKARHRKTEHGMEAMGQVEEFKKA